MPSIAENRFVVAGGASLLGSHIGRQLLDAGAREVVLIDNLALGSTSVVADLLADARCVFLRADITRLNELLDPFEGAAGVFSVAGFLGAPMLANPWMGLDVNIRGLQNVLEASRVRGVGKVVFSSSMGVYGRIGAGGVDEDAPFDWNGLAPGLILYSGSKVVGEGLCRLYEQQHGLPSASLRYSNLYGENQHRRALDGTRIVQAWERIRSGQRPIIEGDGRNVADFVYVGDVARANLMAMASEATGGFNIVSGRDASFNEIVAALLAACGSDLTPEHVAPAGKIGNPVVTKLGVSRAKAKREFGWAPEVDLGEGMRRLVAWLDAQS